MSSEHGHRSAAGAPSRNRDRRPTELTDQLLASNFLNASLRMFGRDPLGVAGLERQQHINRPPLQTGKIVFSLPYSHWYVVQLDGTGGTIGCTCASDSTLRPIGPRSIGTYPPDTAVIVMRTDQPYGIILCAFPTPYFDSSLVCPDMLIQGSQSGIKREPPYRDLAKRMYRHGGQYDFGAGRPLDGTTMEWGKITETGGAIMLDPFMAFMRISEMCGVWFNYWDQATRLAGMKLDIQNPAFEITACDDEGEPRYIESHGPYIWEQLGLYAHGTAVNAAFSPQDVQLKRAKTTFDLPDGAEDVQSISRYQEHGGYLGQGRRRAVMIPGKTSGVRLFKDDPATSPDLGVFEEHIGLDGNYTLRSAGQISIIKTCLIPVPKEMHPPESQDQGDDARKNNYKFAGTFGGDKPHKIGDVDLSAASDHQQLLRVEGLADVLAYNFNWKPLHPFHYHTQDYKVPEESDLKNSGRGSLNRVQDKLDFDSLSRDMFMAEPDPVKVKVDDRYGQVNYYQRQCGFYFTPEGSVVIFSGDGSRIVLGGGHIRFESPGDLQLMPGRSLVALAGHDVMLRAKNSFDITAGAGDGRLKAEKNLQVLGGNKNGGGVLVETKSPGLAVDFDNKIGEDVVLGGIILRASQSAVVALGGDIYLRTGTQGSGPGDLRSGQIVLDAFKGKNNIVLKCDTVETFVRSAMVINVVSDGTNPTVTRSHYFGNGQCQLDGFTVINGDAAVMGQVLINGACQANGPYVSITGPEKVSVPQNKGSFTAAISELTSGITTIRKSEQSVHKADFDNWLYAAKAIGDDTVLRQVEFSFRDDDDGKQYLVAGDFAITESRWQQMARLGLGSGGQTWDEPTVNYQGREQLPWPGKKKWQDDDALLQLEKLTLFDPAKGLSVDRAAGAYENPKLAGWLKVKPNQGFKTIL